MTSPDPSTLQFDGQGLIVAVAQDAATGTVLMVAYMDREALARTVESIQADCDSDALLLSVHPSGPACHTGQRSCFRAPAILFDQLQATIHQRNLSRPEGSYTAQLLEGGRPQILRKVGEEAIEVIVAADHESDAALAGEVADLWYHAMVLLEERGVDAAAVLRELVNRRR
jgi:phosphoribosyl-ATP pyrophosphohydrolase/phosphoribosyl-AMP cyclohydrolase